MIIPLTEDQNVLLVAVRYVSHLGQRGYQRLHLSCPDLRPPGESLQLSMMSTRLLRGLLCITKRNVLYKPVIQ